MNSNEYKFTIEWTDIKAYWKWKWKEKKKFRWNIIKIIIILRVDYDVKYFTKRTKGMWINHMIYRRSLY